MSMQISHDHKRGDQDSLRPKPNDLAIHWFGKPIHRGSVTIGHVAACETGWGSFTPTGELIAVSHSEDAARRAVLARGARECE
jgi:hypothetical protein